MNSALYVGHLQHRRLEPVENRFRYGVYQLLLDLDELDELERRIPFFRHGRRALTSFHDRDHLDETNAPVRVKLEAWLRSRGAALGPSDRVLLLTNARVLGYVFNPVSHFFCLEADGSVRWIVAEVSNTFGDRYAYLLDDLRPVPGGYDAERAKAFHVSPFIFMDDVQYRWRVGLPGERLVIHMDERVGGRKFFDATLSLERRPLTAGTLARALVRYPHMTARTIFLIHWQALRLWLKGAPFFSRPSPPPDALRSRES